MRVRVKIGFADSEATSLTGQYICALEDEPWIPAEAIEPPAFLTGLANRKTPWNGLLASFLIHTVCLAAGFPLAQDLASSGNQPPDTVYLSKPPLRIVLPEHIYYARLTPSNKPDKLRPPAPAPPARQARIKPVAPAIVPAETPAPAERERRPAKQFRLADLPKTVASEQTLLQPEFDPNFTLREVSQIPTMLLWSPKSGRPPAPKPFVLPGRSTEAAPPPTLDAPPKLQIPQEAVLPAVLPLPRPSPMPLQLVFPPKPEVATAPVSADPARGDPTLLLSVSDTNLSKPEKPITVPAGNQLSRNLNSAPESALGGAVAPEVRKDLKQSAGSTTAPSQDVSSGASSSIHTRGAVRARYASCRPSEAASSESGTGPGRSRAPRKSSPSVSRQVRRCADSVFAG